jgi:Ca2+:H+ antiporter
VSSEILVSAVEPMIHDLGLSEVFAGVIVVALVGSVAEQFTAVQMAWRNRLDVSLAIAAGSSTQIALFVAPVLAFVSLPLGHPLDLIFSPLELAVLGVATALFAYISVDGESNWLEGVQLLGIYAIAACAFFLLPVHPG